MRPEHIVPSPAFFFIKRERFVNVLQGEIMRKKLFCRGVFALLLMGLLFAGPVLSSDGVHNYTIAAQNLRLALKAFQDISGLNLAYSDALVEGKTSTAVQGEYSATQALRLLLTGTGLDSVQTGQGTLVLTKKEDFSQETDSATSSINDNTTAQKTTPNPQTPEANLGTFLVQGKQEQDFDNSLAHMDSLDASDLQTEGANDIKTATHYMPGVSVFRARKGGQSSGFNIRGIGAAQKELGENRVLMTIDGERLPDYFNFGHDHALPMIAGRDNVDFDTIKRMDMIKGPQSAKYGSDGIGGAVNFRTYDPEDFVDNVQKWYAGGKYGYRSANRQHKGTVTLAGKKSLVSGLLIASKTDAKEYSAYKKAEPRNVVQKKRKSQDLQWVDGLNILGKIHIGNDTHRISLLGEKYFKEYDTMLLAGTEGTNWQGNQSPFSLVTVGRERLSLGYRFLPRQSWLEKLHLKIYSQNLHNEDEYYNIKQKQGKVIYRFGDYTQDIYAVKADLNGHFNTGSLQHGWAAGVQYRWEESTRKAYERDEVSPGVYEDQMKKWLPDMRANTLAVYIQDAISLPFGLTITPGVRYENWQYKAKADSNYLASTPDNGAELAEGTMDNTTICPKLRISYAFTKHLTGYGSIAWGEKNPPLQIINGMVRPGHINILPGTDLKPEKTRNHELGLLYNSPNLDISLVGFYNVYRDIFANDIMIHPIYGFGLATTNHDKANIYGVESSIKWKFLTNWFVKGSFTYTKGERDNSNFSSLVQPSISNDWEGIDPLQGKIAIGYDNKIFGINTNCFMSKPYKIIQGDSTVTTPGFAVFNMTGWWKINDKIEFNAGIYNILDKKYWHGIDFVKVNKGNSHIDSFTMPGINFNLGLKIHF